MIGLEAVWSALSRLQDRILDAPTLERGVVLSNGSVQLDSDSAALATVPWILGNTLTPGQRVLTIAWRGYRAAIGSASVPAVPSGSVQAWAGTGAIPAGWLLCDGQARNTADYPALFATIGYTYGGSGATFNTPNLVGRIPVGQWVGEPRTDTIGEMGGEFDHVLTAAEMPVHNHTATTTGTYNGNPVMGGTTYLGPGSITTGSWYFVGGSGSQVGTPNWSTAIGNAGSGATHNNMQPYTIMRYLIKT